MSVFTHGPSFVFECVCPFLTVREHVKNYVVCKAWYKEQRAGSTWSHISRDDSYYMWSVN